MIRQYCMYAVNISASFYKVGLQYEHKNEVWWAMYRPNVDLYVCLFKLCLFQIS